MKKSVQSQWVMRKGMEGMNIEYEAFAKHDKYRQGRIKPDTILSKS